MDVDRRWMFTTNFRYPDLSFAQKKPPGMDYLLTLKNYFYACSDARTARESNYRGKKSKEEKTFSLQFRCQLRLNSKTTKCFGREK